MQVNSADAVPDRGVHGSVQRTGNYADSAGVDNRAAARILGQRADLPCRSGDIEESGSQSEKEHHRASLAQGIDAWERLCADICR